MLFQRFEEYMQSRGREICIKKSGGSARVS